MENKKGQLGNLQGIIVVIIVVGILIGAGFLILDEFLNQSDNVVATVTNESGAFINETGYTLSDASSALAFNSPVITLASNSTSGVAIPVANLTVTAEGVVTNATLTVYEAVNLTYSYQHGRSAFTGVNSTILAMLTIPNLLGLIILIAMVGIILAVIFNTIPGARVSGA